MKKQYYKGPITDHFNGRRFFNPDYPLKRNFLNCLKWRLKSNKQNWRGLSPHVVQTDPVSKVQGLRITMIGHATLLIQMDGYNILVDPVWSARIGPLRFWKAKRFNLPGVPFFHLPHIDAVLITHNHYDHMDLRSLNRIRKRYNPIFFVPLGNEALLQKVVTFKKQIKTLDWKETAELATGINITLWPAYHWSARTWRDWCQALWGGFIISSKNHCVYVTGDTAYRNGQIFRDLKEVFPTIDVAIITIGSYEPRWFMKDFHNDPKEAVQILQDCGAKQALGTHWGTFQFSDEELFAPVHALYKALRNQHLSADCFIPLHPGQVWNLKDSAGS